MHLRAFAIDGALQLQTSAMILRELCSNHLAVIRSVVPEKRASVSPNSDFAMFNKVQG
jgi:hypothetical protein